MTLRTRRRTALGALAAAICLFDAAAGAGDAAAPGPLPEPGAAPWEPLTFRSIPEHTRYRRVPDLEGRPALVAETRCGASGRVLRLDPPVDLDRTPRLAWRWRVDAPLDGDDAAVDERVREGDDFAARVYVSFPFDSAKASMMQRLERAIGERLYGADLPGATLSYVWPRAVAAGTDWTSPARAEALLVAVEAPTREGVVEGWREVIVDVRRDARERLGLAPGVDPIGIGLMTDADDTCGTARAAYADFRWLGPEKEPALP